MTSLRDYVIREFPEHAIDVLKSDEDNLELTDHTVVSYAVGRQAGEDLLRSYRRTVPQARVAAVRVQPTDATVLPTDREDADGVLDLPLSRVAMYVVGGFLVVGIVATLLAFLFGATGSTGWIIGVFAGVVGAIVGAIVGGSRFAGQRATTQPRAPGRSVTVVAAFLDDEATAGPLAKGVGRAADCEVRIVADKGAWHSPGTVGS